MLRIPNNDLRVGLLDLSSTVIGDINLYGISTPPDQPGRWAGASIAGDGRSTPAVSTSQAPVAPTPSAGRESRVDDQPDQ